jgi:hypothetical protein
MDATGGSMAKRCRREIRVRVHITNVALHLPAQSENR